MVWQAIKCTMVQQNEWVPVQKGNFLCTRRLTAEIMEPFTNIFFCVANNKIVGQWSLVKCIIDKEINRKKKTRGNKIPSSRSWSEQLENICKGRSFASLCVRWSLPVLAGRSVFCTLYLAKPSPGGWGTPQVVLSRHVGGGLPRWDPRAGRRGRKKEISAGWDQHGPDPECASVSAGTVCTIGKARSSREFRPARSRVHKYSASNSSFCCSSHSALVLGTF